MWSVVGYPREDIVWIRVTCLEDHETTPIGALAAIRRVSHCASIRTVLLMLSGVGTRKQTRRPPALSPARAKQSGSEAEDSNYELEILLCSRAASLYARGIPPK